MWRSFHTRVGRTTAVFPMSQSGTWCPTWRPRSSAQRKIHEYFEAGVSQVWIIYPPQREVYVYTATNRIEVLQLGQDLDGGDLLPGFRLPLATLFEDDAEPAAT